mmetsp:Transcript_42877/g.134545  ORF Transcript_42877/g.134545 Transcript_42877/m.134545 type:complete len:272 (+) Transcript_42877:771-1586(+)
MVDLAFGLALGLGLGLGLVWFILTLEHSVQAAALLNVNEGGAAVPRGDAKVAIQIDEVEPALATQRQRQAQPGPDLQDRLVDGTVQALHGAVLGHHRLVGHASVDLATSSGAEVHHVFEAVVGHVEDLLLPLAVACRLLRIRGGGALARVDEVPSAVRHLRVVAHVLPARREFLHLLVQDCLQLRCQIAALRELGLALPAAAAEQATKQPDVLARRQRRSAKVLNSRNYAQHIKLNLLGRSLDGRRLQLRGGGGGVHRGQLRLGHDHRRRR